MFTAREAIGNIITYPVLAGETALGAIIMTLCENIKNKNPHARYTSAEALGKDSDKMLIDQKVEALKCLFILHNDPIYSVMFTARDAIYQLLEGTTQ